MRVFLAVSLISLWFAAYTDHAWEDYWITFRASRNLATGHGLVFTVGERLHTFTSPLGVLLPAGLSWLTGNGSDELVLWLFRFVSIAALATGVVLLLKILLKLQLNQLSIFLTVALVAMDAKTIDFSINGMETGLLLFFLALTIHGLLVDSPRQVLRVGIGWAGLMWSRPDSFVYIGALGLAALAFLPINNANQRRKDLWKTLVRAGLICTVMYLPWFLWAWWYYGSPVPYTIMAKATNTPAIVPTHLIGRLLLFPARLVAVDTSLAWTFLPAYAGLGGWHYTLHAASKTLGFVAAFAWLIPLLRPQTRMLSLAFYLGQFFLSEVVRSFYPWYLPTVEVLGYLTVGLVFDQLLSLALRLPQFGWDQGWFRHLPMVLRVSAVLLVMGQITVTACVARQMQVQQDLIENGMRRQIGNWLRQHAQSPQDTVLLESLGYIGYFSGLKMLDYPGLSSKEMVEVRRRLGPAKENRAYLELKPKWIVLRRRELTDGYVVDPTSLEKFYEPVVWSSAAEQINATRWLAGKGYLQYDQTFVVLRRKTPGNPKPAP